MNRLLLVSAVVFLLGMTGCDHRAYYAPTPVVAYTNQVPPLVQAARQNGYHSGYDDGARDAYYRAGFAPRRDRNFHDAPGYDYRLGPIHPYVDSFREAYLRGYENGFYHR